MVGYNVDRYQLTTECRLKRYEASCLFYLVEEKTFAVASCLFCFKVWQTRQHCRATTKNRSCCTNVFLSSHSVALQHQQHQEQKCSINNKNATTFAPQCFLVQPGLKEAVKEQWQCLQKVTEGFKFKYKYLKLKVFLTCNFYLQFSRICFC